MDWRDPPRGNQPKPTARQVSARMQEQFGICGNIAHSQVSIWTYLRSTRSCKMKLTKFLKMIQIDSPTQNDRHRCLKRNHGTVRRQRFASRSLTRLTPGLTSSSRLTGIGPAANLHANPTLCQGFDGVLCFSVGGLGLRSPRLRCSDLSRSCPATQSTS